MAIVARTALVVGFCTAEEGEDDHCMSGEEAECRKEQGDAAAAQDCADLLAKRQLLLPQQAGGGGGGGEQRMRVWEENEGMPDEVAELSVQFRRRLGWKDDDDHHHHHHHHPAATAQPYGSGLDTWRGRSLRLMDEARAVLFPAVKISHATEQAESSYECTLTDAEVVIYPLGIGFLILHLDWLPPHGSHRRLEAVKLEELQPRLSLATSFRHHHHHHGVEGTLSGWTFGKDEDPTFNQRCAEYTCWEKSRSQGSKERGLDQEDRNEEKAAAIDQQMDETSIALEQHFWSLGKMGKALYGAKPITLAAFGDWLLHLPNENPASPPRRINTKHCYHHTTVVVDKELTKGHVYESLFRLTRPFSPAVDSIVSEWPDRASVKDSLERVYALNRNRYIGLSQEGTVCISWPMRASEDFDVNGWPALFQGIYLLLTLQVCSERAVLFELLHQANSLNMHPEMSSEHAEEPTSPRKLAIQMMQYTLSMSSDDCGGCSEYARLFATLRLIFGIPSLKAAIREKIDYILGIVESIQLEEQKKLKWKALQDEISANQQYNQFYWESEKKRRRVELVSYTITSATIPLVAIPGLLSMNIPDIPNYTFNQVAGFCSGLAGLILLIAVIIYIIYFRNKRRAAERKKKLQRKLAKIKQRTAMLRPSMEARRAGRISERDSSRSSRSYFRSFDFKRSAKSF